MKEENEGKVTVTLETYDMLREFKEEVQSGKIVKEHFHREYMASHFGYYTESDIIKRQSDKINNLIDELAEASKERYEFKKIKDMSTREFRRWKTWQE